MNDPSRTKWIEEYPGKTDDGKVLPINMVIPGAIVNGIPVGYMEADTPEQAVSVWDWKWENSK
jgi:hypothetical protein